MAFVPCEWYYENMLGDSCDNNCDECFGDKNIYICKASFEVTGDMLEMVSIEQNSWWELKFMNNDHVLLYGTNNHELRIKRNLFDSHFESFIYNKGESEE